MFFQIFWNISYVLRLIFESLMWEESRVNLNLLALHVLAVQCWLFCIISQFITCHLTSLGLVGPAVQNVYLHLIVFFAYQLCYGDSSSHVNNEKFKPFHQSRSHVTPVFAVSFSALTLCLCNMRIKVTSVGVVDTNNEMWFLLSLLREMTVPSIVGKNA